MLRPPLSYGDSSRQSKRYGLAISRNRIIILLGYAIVTIIFMTIRQSTAVAGIVQSSYQLTPIKSGSIYFAESSIILDESSAPAAPACAIGTSKLYAGFIAASAASVMRSASSS